MTTLATAPLAFSGSAYAVLDDLDHVDTTTLETLLGTLLDGLEAAEFLRNLVADPEQLARIAEASYWHANGFAKLVLHRTARSCIRLHIWPHWRLQLGELEPHSHRWDFASTVLSGTLTVLESEEISDGTGLSYVRYSYNGLTVEPRVPTSLRAVARYVVGRGERYVTDTSVIHTVHPHPGVTASTLLLQGPHRCASTDVYRVPGAPGLPPAHPISLDEVRVLLNEVGEATGLQ